MRQMLYSTLLSLVTGMAFALGMFLIFLAADAWNRGPGASTDDQWVDHPAGLVVAESQRIEGTPTLTIQGVVENRGDRIWSQVSVEATILAGAAQVNQCEESTRGPIAPGERRPFQIECFKVAGSGLPDNIRYQLSVASARTQK